MVQSKANTVKQYLNELSDDRRDAISAIRDVILENLPDGIEEGMQWGMIGYFVPHRIYPSGYHCQPDEPLPFASLANQKNHMAFYGFNIYIDEKQQEWFVKEWKKTGKKLDMGKSCVRFKKLDDVPLSVLAKLTRRCSVEKYIKLYEKQLEATRKK